MFFLTQLSKRLTKHQCVLSNACLHNEWAKRFFVLPLAFCSAVTLAQDWQYDMEVGTELTQFASDAPYGQSNSNASIRVLPEIYKEWNDGANSFAFSPFVRIDQRDPERTHADIRELAWIHVADAYELRVGVRKVFWGVTESQHLVDIINQTDAVESIDGEDKLGQPMVNLSLVRDWGTLDLFWLVGFRERTFPGGDGRLRYPSVVHADKALYESSAEERRSDFAIRWQQTLGDWEVGLSHFSGTSRAPNIFVVDGVSQPFYPVIDQSGMDIQTFYESWLWKLELISRGGNTTSKGHQGRYTAATFGFEFSQVGIFGSAMDLGWVVEYLFDDRKKLSSGFNEQDVLLGLRWTWNNEASTDALLGVLFDTETSESALSLEVNHRLAQNWKLELEARLFTGSVRPPTLQEFRDNGIDPENKMASFSDEDFIKVEFIYYY